MIAPSDDSTGSSIPASKEWSVAMHDEVESMRTNHEEIQMIEKGV